MRVIIRREVEVAEVGVSVVRSRPTVLVPTEKRREKHACDLDFLFMAKQKVLEFERLVPVDPDLQVTIFFTDGVELNLLAQGLPFSFLKAKCPSAQRVTFVEVADDMVAVTEIALLVVRRVKIHLSVTFSSKHKPRCKTMVRISASGTRSRRSSHQARQLPAFDKVEILSEIYVVCQSHGRFLFNWVGIELGTSSWFMPGVSCTLNQV